ncbi:MAG: hypothetical protein H7A46_22765 [Verrucomicrobiales bacterium]|nr:hypothetical protein [Planctomycetota bacterium]MCP5524365.1 hypothetical protein [Verrucomicrobiales bacterium]
MKYDDASWHFESTPEGSEDERWKAAAAHIGVYLKWCLVRGWASPLLLEGDEDAARVEQVRSGSLTGTAFLNDWCDSKFIDDLLVDEANAFTAYYYNGDYISDVELLVRGKLLSAAEEAYDFPRLQKVMDTRYDEWVSLGRPSKKPKKPWWKIW